MRSPFSFPWLMLLGLAFLVGCGGEESSEESAPAPEETAEEAPAAEESADAAKAVDVKSLPKLGDYLPPLDGGLVNIAPPDGWSQLSRSPKYLVRFYHIDKTELPRIEVTSAPNPLADFGDVTTENAGAFAEQMKPLSSQGKRQVLEPCIPLSFGDSAWSRHVRIAKSPSGDKVQIQSLQTIREGKLYTVELLVEGEEASELRKFKDYGYAVAAGMKFGPNADVPPPTSFKVPGLEPSE